jgi:ribosome-associated translation inhibitor RaiA
MTSLLPRITFHGIDRSLAVEHRIHAHIEKLLRISSEIARADVVVEMPHRHHRHGRRFHVRIELGLPGRTIVVSHDGGSDAAHEDVYVTVRDAFLAARRQLEVHVAMAAEAATRAAS